MHGLKTIHQINREKQEADAIMAKHAAKDAASAALPAPAREELAPVVIERILNGAHD